MQRQVRDYQRKVLIDLIREVSALYGGDTDDFLNEYIAEVLNTWNNDLMAAITCFEGLKAQAPVAKVATVATPSEKLRGHPAFREHYARLERTPSREHMAEAGQNIQGKVT